MHSRRTTTRGIERNFLPEAGKTKRESSGILFLRVCAELNSCKKCKNGLARNFRITNVLLIKMLLVTLQPEKCIFAKIEKVIKQYIIIKIKLKCLLFNS